MLNAIEIGTAYTVLGERSSRRQYDKDHEKYQVPEEVNPQNLWDEEFHDNAFDGDTDPPSSDEEDDLDVDPNVKPDDQTLRIYRTATPVVAKYLSGEREAAYDNELERFNVALKKGNKGRKLAEDRFLISINVLKAISIELNHVFEAARKKEGRLDRQKLSVLEEQLEKIKRTYAYPEGWAIIIPKDVEEISSARKDDNSPSTSSSHTESVPETSSASQATSAPETTSVATLLPKQVQEVQTETQTVWKRMKWNTHSTSNGDTILAYKALSRLGNDPYGYEFVVMTKQSPYFEVMTGSEIGRRTRDDYLALPNIYKINTDPGDDKTPRYSYRDKKKYDRLLFAATKPRKLAKAGGVPRTGDTQCCIMWKDGTVAIMARAHFKKVADEDESSAIAVFCESLDTPPPWNRDPKALPVPTNTPLGQELLRAGRSGSLLSISSLSGSKGDLIPASNSGGTTDVALITNLQSSVSSVQASLEAMESRVENKMAKMMEHISAQQEELKLQREESNKINAGLMQVLSKLNLGS